jgi:rhodanese-related sulfurtransferase
MRVSRAAPQIVRLMTTGGRGRRRRARAPQMGRAQVMLNGGVEQSERKQKNMAKTFKQMVSEARQEVQAISPQEAQQRLQSNPNTLVVDVREPNDPSHQSLGDIPGSKDVPLGVLAIRADLEMPESVRDQDLQDRSRPVITTCQGGGQAALAAKTLKDMGFTNVTMIEGGTQGWKDAALPTEQPAS